MQRQILTVLACVALAAAAGGQTTWTGTNSSDWTDPGNWTAGVPTSSTNTTIPAVTAPASAPSTAGAVAECGVLTVDPGAAITIDAASPLDIHGSATLDGTFSGSGTVRIRTGNVTVSGSATLPNLEIDSTHSSATVLSGLTVAGDLTLTNGLLRPAGSTVVTVFGNAYFHGGSMNTNNNQAGDFDISGDVEYSGCSVTSFPDTYCSGNLVADPAVVATGGTVYFDGGGTQLVDGNGAVFPEVIVSAGTTIQLVSTLNATNDLTVNGTIDATAASLDADDDFTIAVGGSVDLGGLTHQLGKDVVVDGGLTHGAGALLVLNATANSVLRSAGASLPSISVQYDPGARINIDESMTITGSFDMVSGVFRRTGGGTCLIQGPATFSGGHINNQVGSGLVDIDGPLTFSGTTTGEVSVFQCSGDVSVDASFAPGSNSSDFLLDGGAPGSPQLVTQTGGAFRDLVVTIGAVVATADLSVARNLVVDGSLTVSGTLDFDADSTVSATGVLDLGSGSHFFAGGLAGSGAITSTGTITWNNPATQTCAVSNATFHHVVVAGTGILNLNGDLTMTGDLTLTGANLRLTNGGLRTVAGAATFSAGIFGGEAAATIDFNGPVVFSGCTATDLPGIMASASFTSDALVQDTGEGSLTLDGGAGQPFSADGSRFEDFIVAAGTTIVSTLAFTAEDVTVDGSLTLMAPFTVAAPLVVNGSMTAAAPLDVNGPITVNASGTLDLGAVSHQFASNLIADGGLSSTGTVTFDGASATVRTDGGGSLADVVVATSGNCVFQGAVTITGDLTLNTGTVKPGNPSGTIGIAGDFNGNGGGFAQQNSNSSVFAVAGNLLFTGTATTQPPTTTCAGDVTLNAAVQAFNGTWTLDGLTPQNLDANGGKLANLVVAAGADVTLVAALTLDDDLIVHGDLDASASAFDVLDFSVTAPTGAVDIGAISHVIRGAVTVDGSVTGSGALTLISSAQRNINASTPLPSLVVAYTSFGACRLSGDLTISGDLTLNSGPLQRINGGVCVVEGDATFSGGIIGSGPEMHFQGSVSFAGVDATGAIFAMRASGDVTADAGFSPVAGTPPMILDGTAQTVTMSGGAFHDVTVEVGTTVTTAGTFAVKNTCAVKGSLVAGGTLDFTFVDVQAGGTLDAGTETVLSADNFTLDGTYLGSSPVTFDPTGLAVIDGSTPFPSVVVNATGTVRLHPVTVAGDITVLAGTIESGGGGVRTIQGDFTVTGGAVSSSTGTWDFDGDVSIAAGIPTDFGGGVNSFAGSVALGGPVAGIGAFSLMILDGAGDVSSSGPIASVDIDTTGTVTFSGTVSVRSLELIAGTVQVQPGGVVHVQAPGTFIPGTADFDGGTLLDGGGSFDCDGAVTFAGTTVGAMPDMSCAGAFVADVNLQATSGTLTLDGTGSPTFSLNGATLHDLVIGQNVSLAPSGAIPMGGDLTVAGSLVLADALTAQGSIHVESLGSLELGAFTHSCGGSFTIDGALTIPEGPTTILVLTGTGTVSATDPLPEVHVDAPGGTVSFDGNLTLGSDLRLIDGTLEPTGAGSVQVQGNASFEGGLFQANDGVFDFDGNAVFTGTLVNDLPDSTCAGTFTGDSGVALLTGTLTVDGGAGQVVDLPGSKLFNFIVAAGTTVTLVDPLCVDGDLTVGGALTLTAPGDIEGDVLVPVTGTFDFSTTGVACASSFTVDGALVPGGTLIVDGAGTIKSVAVLPSTQVSAIGVVNLEGAIAIGGDFTLDTGILTPLALANVNITGNAMFQGGSMTAAPSGEQFDVGGNVDFSGTSVTDLPDFFCGGNWTSDTSLSSPTSGTIVMDGTTQTFTATGSTLQNLTIASTSTTTLAGSLGLAGTLQVDGTLLAGTPQNLTGDVDVTATGQLDLGGGAHSFSSNMTVGGSVQSTGTVTFNGLGTLSAVGGTTSFQNLVIDASTHLEFEGTIHIFGDLSHLGGLFRPKAGSITNITGNAMFQGGSMMAEPGAVINVAGNTDFSNSVSGAMELNCGGDWTSGPGFLPTSGVVTMNGSTQSLSVNGSSFFDLVIAASSTTTLVSGTLTVLGTLTVEGTLDLGAGTHSFAGSLTINGTLQGGGTLVFTGSGTLQSSSSVPSIVVNVTGGTFSLGGTFTIAGSLTLQDGTLEPVGGGVVTVQGSADFQAGTLAANDGSLDLDGNVTFGGTTATTPPDLACSAGFTADAAFAPTSGTVTLDGTGALSSTAPGGALDFFDLVVTTGTHTLAAGTAATANTLNVDPTGTLDVASETLTLAAGTHTVDGGLSLSAGGQLALGAASAMTFGTTSSLTLDGSASSPASIVGAAGGGYALTIGGAIAAKNFEFLDPGAAGVVIQATASFAALPNDFRGGLFDRSSSDPSSVLLHIQQASPVDLRYLVFEDSTATGVFNVRTLAGSAITMTNWLGAFAGDTFEDDPSGLITWAAPDLSLVTFTATGGPLSATLDWASTHEVDADTWIVERADDPAGPWTEIAQVPFAGPSTYQVTDTGLVAGHLYHYRLRERLLHGPVIDIAQASTRTTASGAVANVVTVGPGQAFTDIQSAINAVTGFQTIIKLLPGTYAPFTIASLPQGTVWIVGHEGAATVIDTATAAVQISNVAANAAVVLAHVQVGDAGSPNPGLVITSCAGAVILDESEVHGGAGQAGILADASDAVMVQGCVVDGTPGMSLVNGATAVVGRGALDDADLVGGSDLRLLESAAATTADGTSTVQNLPGLMPYLDAPTSINVGDDLFLAFEAAPSVAWNIALRLATGVSDVLEGPFFDTPLLMPTTGTLLVTPAATEPSGVGLYDQMTGAAVTSFFAPIVGSTLTFQAVVFEPLTGKFRFSNVQHVFILP